MVGKDNRLDGLFQALSNTTRREIVSLLLQKPYYITQLAPKFSMSLAAVSKHIKVLEQAGLIEREIKGRNHLCRINSAALKDASGWISSFEDERPDRMDALEQLAE